MPTMNFSHAMAALAVTATVWSAPLLANDSTPVTPRDAVRSIVSPAADIFSRVPCRAPKGGVSTMTSLPHIAGKLVAGEPVVIVAFGSSSTEGAGATARQYTYPDRLAAQLRRKYPAVDISVINAGKGGEDTPEMMARLQRDVLDHKPDLVIWQVGTNAVLRNLDPANVESEIETGVQQIKSAGADLVLIDPQYCPATAAKREAVGKMVSFLSKVAEVRKVGLFPRFEVMREWHEGQSLAFDKFVVADGLHMNDWGYACFAQLLGDNIIKTVGEIKTGERKSDQPVVVSR